MATMTGAIRAIGQLSGGSQSGNAPAPSSGGTPGTNNRNLSLAQFGHQAHAVRQISDFAKSAVSAPAAVPDIGDPAYMPPNSISPGLYT